MKTIPREFNKHGYSYTLVTRIGDIAIYSQEKESHRILRSWLFGSANLTMTLQEQRLVMNTCQVLKSGEFMDGH